MLLNSISLLLVFAVSALALSITTPAEDDERVDFSKPYKIRWNSVPSDPEHFTITLVNANGNNVNKDIATNVDSSKGEYRVDRVSGVPVANGYQINIRSTERNNMGILAQSKRFNVTKVAQRAEESETPSANATRTSSEEAPPTETNAAAGNGQGFLLGSGVVAGMMGLAVLAL